MLPKQHKHKTVAQTHTINLMHTARIAAAGTYGGELERTAGRPSPGPMEAGGKGDGGTAEPSPAPCHGTGSQQQTNTHSTCAITFLSRGWNPTIRIPTTKASTKGTARCKIQSLASPLPCTEGEPAPAGPTEAVINGDDDPVGTRAQPTQPTT